MGIIGLVLPAVVFGFAAWGIALFVTEKSINIALRRGVLAHANERTSHEQPTPRLGGIGLVAGVLVPLAVYLVFSKQVQRMTGLIEFDPVQWKEFAGFYLIVALAFLLGLWDDRGNPPAVAKLIGQIIIAGIAPATGLVVRQLQLPFVGIFDLPTWLGAALGFAWVLLLMNTVNFMDGINGLAGRFGVVIGATLLSFALNRPWMGEIAVLGAAMIGASAGFLHWNFPEAKTFLGDCGSQPLGAMVAAGTLLFVTNDIHSSLGARVVFDPFIPCIIAVSVFVFDVLLTLGRRIARGENPLRAHREHLYQRFLVARGENHETTTEMVTWHLYAAGGLAFLYVQFTNAQANYQLFRAILIAGAVVNLVVYFMAVKKAEAQRRTA